MNVKRVLGLLMVCLLVLNLSNVETGASESTKKSVDLQGIKYSKFKEEKSLASNEYETLIIEFIKTNYDKNVSIKKTKKLYNLYGDLEALAFDFKTGGYAIININDKSIPEFSFEGKYPVNGSSNISANFPCFSYSRLTHHQ